MKSFILFALVFSYSAMGAECSGTIKKENTEYSATIKINLPFFWDESKVGNYLLTYSVVGDTFGLINTTFGTSNEIGSDDSSVTYELKDTGFMDFNNIPVVKESTTKHTLIMKGDEAEVLLKHGRDNALETLIHLSCK